MRQDRGTQNALIKDILEGAVEKEVVHLIVLVASGYYHDFETPLAFPKHELVCALQNIGRDDLVKKCIAGKYDDRKR